MKLYTHPGSCSSAAHIALLETGVNFDVVKVNLMGDRSLPDGRKLSDVNPKGYVPVLELDNGEVLTELVAILPYIADLKPAAGLAPPAGTLARSRLLEWLGYINSELHKSCGFLFAPNMPEEAKATIKSRLAMRLEYVDKYLATHDYLGGDRFNVADAYLYVVLGWAPHLKLDLAPYSHIAKYQARVGQRASVKTAQAAAKG
jgi:glutathione S-transferase